MWRGFLRSSASVMIRSMQDAAPRKPSTEAGHLFFATQNRPLTVLIFSNLIIYFGPVGATYLRLGDELQPAQETAAGVTLTLMASKQPRPPSQHPRRAKKVRFGWMTMVW